MDYGDKRLPDRFWKKVHPEPNTGCWLWAANTHRQGYGKFQLSNPVRKQVTTHRYILEHETGVTGPTAMHSCDTPACVNPEHLRWDSPCENSEDMARKGRAANRFGNNPGTCIRGHLLSGDNLSTGKYVVANKRRKCKACDADRARDKRRQENAK